MKSNVPYYTKSTTTLPSSKTVFCSESRRLAMRAIDDKFSGLTLPELQSKLQAIHRLGTLDKFRLSILGISKALSNYGIAPRWQGLFTACNTDEQHKALRLDAALIDLYWLSITFPKHKPRNTAWQQIFTNGFDIDLAVRISERDISTARKIKHELKLSTHQQLGCIRFCQQGKDSAKGKLTRAKGRVETVYERQMARSATTPQITAETARYRAQIWQCWLLAEESPTKAAAIYRWMTGSSVDKSNLSRTIKRIENPKK